MKQIKINKSYAINFSKKCIRFVRIWKVWSIFQIKKSNMLGDTVFEYVEKKYPAHMTKVFRRTENIRRNTGKSFSYLNRNFC